MGLMSKLTASYLAGLIDGEGCMEIQKRKKPECFLGYYYVARVRITSTDKEIIEWLKESFGGWISERKGVDRNRDSWEWCLSYGKAKKFIEKVCPYLKIKKKQAEILREFYRTFGKNSYRIVENRLGRGTGYHKELKKEILEKREKLYQQIKALNKKGRVPAR